MKKTIITLLMISSSFLYAAKSDSYNFKNAGKVKLSALEKAISPGLSYADIKIDKLRRSYSPFQQGLGSVYVTYVISFTLKGMDKATCDLTEITDEGKFMINDCKSETATVSHEGFIHYEDLNVRYNNY